MLRYLLRNSSPPFLRTNAVRNKQQGGRENRRKFAEGVLRIMDYKKYIAAKLGLNDISEEEAVSYLEVPPEHR